MAVLNKIPNLVYANSRGDIYDNPAIEMAGKSAGNLQKINPDDLISLPEGSELFSTPDRIPVGWDRNMQDKISVNSGDEGEYSAVSAFLAPAHTSLLNCAYESREGSQTLPLFSYCAVGWLDGKFWVPAIRVDSDIRQDIGQFNINKIRENSKTILKQYPKNRLLRHLSGCALTYGCPAAKNLFMNRWEAPLPTSPSCNANCVGCISLQEDAVISPTQPRIEFVPTPEEIAEVAVSHIKSAEKPVVSFGQGCEGEPLLQHKTIERAIKFIRNKTKQGTINLNTNASIPSAIETLCRAGLDSIRVSMNSADKKLYNLYYRPRNYGLENVIQSINIAKALNKFVSINLLTFPGITDSEKETETLISFLKTTAIDMIQWRNLNIDPDVYVNLIKPESLGNPIGIKNLMELIKKEFPHIRFGYFNPYLEKSSVIPV